MNDPTSAADAPDIARAPHTERWLGWILLIAGAIALAASYELAVEKFRLLENPLYVPACSLGEVVNCASVMRSSQSEALGFPNAFLGLAGYGALTAIGLILVTGGRLTRPFWIVLQAGLLFAVLFVHWLMIQALYNIGALCPFCMALWAATIPAFWYVTVCNITPFADKPGATGTVVRFALRNHGIIITAWLLLITALVAERFWAPWDSIFI